MVNAKLNPVPEHFLLAGFIVVVVFFCYYENHQSYFKNVMYLCITTKNSVINHLKAVVIVVKFKVLYFHLYCPWSVNILASKKLKHESGQRFFRSDQSVETALLLLSQHKN